MRPIPTQAPAARRREPADRVGKMPWGWLEWVIVGQTLFPALLFVPGLTKIRFLLRVASFGLSLTAWAVVAARGRRASGKRFAAAPWLAFCAGWLALMLAHPEGNGLVSALASMMLNLAILAPVFWAPALADSTQRVTRLLTIMLVCNAASTIVGILQFYRPGTFDPPALMISEIMGDDYVGSLSYTTADGREVLRPCGLTDTPGAASLAGSYTCLIGVAWILRPIGHWRQAACLFLGLAGMAVVYFSQVRTCLVLTLVGLVQMAVMLALRRDYGKLSRLLTVGALIVFGSIAWAVRDGGEVVMERFLQLMDEAPGEAYYENRGRFLEETFDRYLWDYPLGAGLGRWGMMYYYFGDKSRPSLWSEIQPTAWIFDGGIPLLLAYSLGIGAAVLATVRLALRSRDAELANLASVICAICLSILAACLSSMPFIGPVGIQFWVILGALHGAAGRAGAPRRPAVRKPSARLATSPPAGWPPRTAGARR